jgi:hypothetical protein
MGWAIVGLTFFKCPAIANTQIILYAIFKITYTGNDRQQF